MKLTREQAANYLNSLGAKYKGRSFTYRTIRTMTENGDLEYEKLHLGKERFIYRIDTSVLDEWADEQEDGDFVEKYRI